LTVQLLNNFRKSFEGFKVYGQGFLFDDKDPKATPISGMNHLIENNPRNQERIFPYIGGEEIKVISGKEDTKLSRADKDIPLG
jgi:hypothetical protein